MGQRSPVEVASQAPLTEPPLEEGNPRLLPWEAQNVLRPSRVPLEDRRALRRHRASEFHPADGQHSHRAEGERKETDPSTEKLSIALPKVGPSPVFDRPPSSGKRERRVDHHEIRVEVCDEIEDLLVGVQYARFERFRPRHDARASVAVRGTGEVEPDDPVAPGPS